MPEIVRPLLSMQYDGTNGSFIAGTWCTGIGFVSDTGTVLTYTDADSNPLTANLDEWFVINEPNSGYPEIYTTVQYESRYFELVPPPELKLAAGYALTPTILASASANVAVNLDTAMSGIVYQATAVLAGAASLLGSLAITAVAITDADTVTVTVQNNGVVSLAGATVIVCAAELA